MANDDHIARLKKWGVMRSLLETLRPKVKAWRAKQDRASRRDLSGVDLSGANLREVLLGG